MNSKNLGRALFISAIIGAVAMLTEAAGYHQFSNLLYMFAGTGLYVFGIWAGFRLTKKENKKIDNEVIN